MVKLLRLLALLFVLVNVSPAHAAFPPIQRCQIDGIPSQFGGTDLFDTCQAAAEVAKGAFSAQPTTPSCNLSYPTTSPCLFMNSDNPNGWLRGVVYRAGCPANSDLVDGQCVCKLGFTQSGTTCGAPAENACSSQKGKPFVTGWTAGYQRTPSTGDRSPLIGASMPRNGQRVCTGGCAFDLDTTDTGADLGATVSQMPNDQGLYRLAVDFRSSGTGETCSPTTDDLPANPQAPNVPCPGYVGEVDGVKGCYGTAEKPVVTQPNPVPSNIPTDAGNPAAGLKPSTGEGSGVGGAGRTPSAGTGGPSGGPAGAAAGSKSTGAGTGTVSGQSQGTGRVGTQAGTEQANCGAPGQSPCKIDETGTPDGKGAMDAAKSAQDKNASDSKAAIDAASTMQGPAWSFSFQLPTGCSSYQVGTFKGLSFTMNPCTYQSTIHDLMSMIWAAVTAMCLIGMVGKTIREA